MELNTANLDLIFRNVNPTFQQAFTQTSTFWKDLAMEIPCGTQQTTLAFLDRVPLMRKWVGPRQIQNAIARSRTIEMERYEHTIALDVNQVEDDQIGLFYRNVQMQAIAGAKLQDQLLSTFLRTQAATVLGYDGVPVYSTAHPINGGTDGGVAPGAPATQSNLLVSTALSYDNYVAARTQMLSWVGMDGAPLLSDVDSLTLMVPPQLEGTAKRILESDFIAQFGSSATSNSPVTNVYKGSAKLLVNPWLRSMPTNWWLFSSSMGMLPFVYHNRQPVTLTPMNQPTSTNVFMNDQYLWGIKARAAVSESVWFMSLAGTSEAAYYPA